MKVINETSRRYYAVLPWFLIFINGKEVGRGVTISAGWLHWSVLFVFGKNKDYQNR